MADVDAQDDRSDLRLRARALGPRHRVLTFVVLCAAAVVVAASYAVSAVRRNSAPIDPATEPVLTRLAALPERPYLMASSMYRDSFRKLVLVPLSAPSGAAYETALECDRAYFAGNRGVCLTRQDQLLTTRYYAYIFDDAFRPLHKIRLTGLPSRTRLTADGRRAAITVFEQGHSYAEHGFSTRTSIIDTLAGRDTGDLEQFTIWRDGRHFKAVDFNFWGVTFAGDSNRFFATLASGGTRYLIEGDVDRREGRVLRTGVECPSLSPDNTRIVYKHMTASYGLWQLRMYDLRTGADTPLTSETRSVDDQVDWLDNEHVMYHITGSRGADVWVLRTDGKEPAKILREYSYSPAIVR